MGITVWPVDAVAGAPNYTARMARQTAGALVGGKTAARPLGGTSGLIAGTGSAVVSATTTTWTVGQCAGVIDGETSTAAGPYFFSNDANVTGPMTAADGTNARIDIISAQLSDPAEGDGTSVPGVAFIYTVGTAASSPVAPATPARAVAIAQINVPHSGAGSPSVTDVAPRVVAAGGVQPCANSVAYPASPYVGQSVYDVALKQQLTWDGTKWAGDTGWVTGTTGWTMLNSTAVSGAFIRKVGKVVSIAVQFATGATTAVDHLGNLANLPLFQLPAAYVASSAPGTGEQGLSAGQSGPLASFTIDNTGTVRICAVDSAFFTLFGTPLASGTSFSVSGTYFTD